MNIKSLITIVCFCLSFAANGAAENKTPKQKEKTHQYNPQKLDKQKKGSFFLIASTLFFSAGMIITTFWLVFSLSIIFFILGLLLLFAGFLMLFLFFRNSKNVDT